MSVPASPRFRMRALAHSRLRRTSVLLLVLAWAVVGTSLWGLFGMRQWFVGQRPAIVLEAFLDEVATPVQEDALAGKIQFERYFCDLLYVSAEEARAEAEMIPRIRPLLDAFGGNPFLSSYRITLCADELDPTV